MKKIALLISMFMIALSAHATVTNLTNSVSYTCTGSVGPFAFGFPISTASAMTVTQNGAVLASTAYIVTPVNNNYGNGGSVTLNAACPAAQTLVLQRVTPLTQTSVFVNNMPAPMTTTGNALDKLTEIAQEMYGAASGGCTLGNLIANGCTGGNSSIEAMANIEAPIEVVPNLPGATADVQIVKCVNTDLSATGGMCDARAWGGSSPSIAATATLHPAKTVTLLCDPATLFTPTGPTVPMFILNENVRMEGCTLSVPYNYSVPAITAYPIETTGAASFYATELFNVRVLNLSGRATQQYNTGTGLLLTSNNISAYGTAFLDVDGFTTLAMGTGIQLSASNGGYVNGDKFSRVRNIYTLDPLVLSTDSVTDSQVAGNNFPNWVNEAPEPSGSYLGSCITYSGTKGINHNQYDPWQCWDYPALVTSTNTHATQNWFKGQAINGGSTPVGDSNYYVDTGHSTFNFNQGTFNTYYANASQTTSAQGYTGTGAATFTAQAGMGSGGSLAGPACGSNGPCTSTDGQVKFTTGGSPSASANVMIITLPVTRTNRPNCTVQGNIDSSGLPIPVVISVFASSTSALVVTVGASALQANTTYDLTYNCFGI